MPNFSNYAKQLAAHTKIFHGKDTNKPSAKANFYLHFAEAKYLRRSQRYKKVGFAVRFVPYFIECGEERFGEDRERIWSVPDFRRLYGR